MVMFLFPYGWLYFQHFAGAPPEAKSAFINKESVQKEVKATLSQKATLSCEVVDNKTEVKWYKDGKLLSPSRAVHMESKGQSRQLVIDSVEKKDEGEYACEVGTQKLVFKVQVTGTTYGREKHVCVLCPNIDWSRAKTEGFTF